MPRAGGRRRLCARAGRRRLCRSRCRGYRRDEGAGRDRRLCAADECGGGGEAVRFAGSLFAIAAVLWVQSACAQEAPASGEAPPPVADPAVALGQALAGTVYTPADFTRSAPKTAPDMPKNRKNEG